MSVRDGMEAALGPRIAGEPECSIACAIEDAMARAHEALCGHERVHGCNGYRATSDENWTHVVFMDGEDWRLCPIGCLLRQTWCELLHSTWMADLFDGIREACR